MPLPDLVIEVEISRSALDRMSIYQALGIPEVWRYSRDHCLTVEKLGPDGYRKQEESGLLGGLPVQELPRFVRVGLEQDSLAMLEAFRSWLARCG